MTGTCVRPAKLPARKSAQLLLPPRGPAPPPPAAAAAAAADSAGGANRLLPRSCRSAKPYEPNTRAWIPICEQSGTAMPLYRAWMPSSRAVRREGAGGGARGGIPNAFPGTGAGRFLPHFPQPRISRANSNFVVPRSLITFVGCTAGPLGRCGASPIRGASPSLGADSANEILVRIPYIFHNKYVIFQGICGVCGFFGWLLCGF